MNPSALLLIFGAYIGLSGCASWWKKPAPVERPSAESLYHKHDVETLAMYSGQLARMGDADRLAECQRVKKLEKEQASIGIRLHLVAVQSIAESCGGLSETLDQINSSRANITEAATLAWADYLERLLRTVAAERDARLSAEDKLKQVKATAKRNARQAKTKETEVRALQNKLDALKSIEQSLGTSPIEQ